MVDKSAIVYNNQTCFAFVRAGTSKDDLDLFLGPIVPLEIFNTFDDTSHKTLAHIIAQAGLFKSVGEAKRNGWDKPIPDGYSEFIIGKRKVSIVILNLKD